MSHIPTMLKSEGTYLKNTSRRRQWELQSFCYSWFHYSIRPLDTSAYWITFFIISHPKHMLRVIKRTVSIRRFFWAPKTHVLSEKVQKHLQFYSLKYFLDTLILSTPSGSGHILFYPMHPYVCLTVRRTMFPLLWTQLFRQLKLERFLKM